MKDEVRGRQSGFSSFILHPSALIVLVCCVLPLGWLVGQIVLNPAVLREMHLDGYRFRLLGRTLFYNGSVGVVATLLALPAAWALGRGRGILAGALAFVLPISLLMPSLVIAYGWKQLLRLLDMDPAFQGFWDVSRCIWSLATWLWPVPAMLIGLALRKSDAQVQQQAVLDGVLGRVMFRQLLGPILAAMSIVAMLAMQEFAVYEPTGISVVATEVRMVFETGAYSSPDNPITQPMGASGGFTPDQRSRAAAAVATALPVFLVVAILACVGWLGTRRLSAAEQLNHGSWPRALDAPWLATLLGWLIVVLTLAVPIVALVVSLKESFDIPRFLRVFSPQLGGTFIVAAVTGMVASVLAFGSVPRRSRGLMGVSVAMFLVGGQILAIALIRIYNRPWLEWAYEGLPVVVMAYIGRFGWIVLGAALLTWSAPWRGVREMAAIDGATPWQAARHVIWPMAWPLLGAAVMFVMVLSMSEVPATVLLSPQQPQMLVPTLMSWVHMQRYDAMIEASLLMASMAVILGGAAVLLLYTGRRMLRVMSLLLVAGMLTGCGQGSSPDAIWCSTGIGPAQVVYPRAIAYSPADDTYFIVDRQARVQHLDNQGKYISEWEMPAYEQGKPVGLSVGPDGNVYVPDTHYYRVMVYAPDGQMVREWGRKGTGPGEFIYTTDIAFDSSGNVFIAEYGDNDRIQVFSPLGEYLYQFGSFGDGPGQFSRPQSILIDQGLVYVADSCNHRLVVFRTDGTFVRTMGGVGSEPGQFRFPYGLDMDSKGRLVVCEFGNNRVQLVDKETGKGLATWGMAGRAPGELAYPWAVVVDKNDRVVAVDAGNNRLQVFEF